MSDPEILDPEGPAAPSSGGATTASGVERLIREVQKALPGQAVRVDVAPPVPGSPQSQLGGAPRFRLEALGEGGEIVVESGPLMTALVSFRSARFSYFLGGDIDKLAPEIAARVRELANDELVVLEEQSSPTLRRTTVVKVKRDRIEGVVDTGVLPHAGAPAAPQFHSFKGTWQRAPTKQEKAQLERLQGGVVGKLKRKLLEKIIDKTAGSLRSAVEQAGENVRAEAAAAGVDVDDGARKLGPGKK